MTTRRLPILAVCAALAAPALTSNHDAHAQGAPKVQQGSPVQIDAATLAKQRELFQQANKLYDENKFPQAEALYAQAWKIKKSYDLAGNFGNMLADAGKPRQAAPYLAFAIREFPAGGKPALRDALIKRLAEVQRLIGTVRVQVNIPRAEVFIDGQSVGLAPITEELYVDPSSHVIEARADGYLPAQESFLASKGKTSDVSLTLVAPKGPNKTVIITGGAVAGAAIVAGAVLLGVSTAKGSTLRTLQDEVKATGGCASETAGGKCEELRSAGQSKATLGNAGLWTLVGGGVVGVATLIYGVAGGPKAPRTGVRVTPIVTGDGGGLIIGGAF